MESTIVFTALVLVSSLASYGYYLTWIKEREEFDQKKETTTTYRANEEFVKSDSRKSTDQ